METAAAAAATAAVGRAGHGSGQDWQQHEQQRGEWLSSTACPSIICGMAQAKPSSGMHSNVGHGHRWPACVTKACSGRGQTSCCERPASQALMMPHSRATRRTSWQCCVQALRGRAAANRDERVEQCRVPLASGHKSHTSHTATRHVSLVGVRCDEMRSGRGLSATIKSAANESTYCAGCAALSLDSLQLHYASSRYTQRAHLTSPRQHLS